MIKIFENFEKCRFSKIFEKFGFGQIFVKISILVKSSENFRFFWKLSKTIAKGQIFEKFRFWSKFSKNSGFGHIFEKFMVKLSKKNSILVKIFENFKDVDFSNIFVKFRFWSKFFEKFRFWLKFSSKIPINFDFGQSINLDFGQIFEKIRFWSKFLKIFEFVQNIGKISIFSKISKNFDWG